MYLRTLSTALVIALVAWTGCDSNDPQVEPPDDPVVALAAASTVASLVGLAPGGALFDLAEAASALDALQRPGRFDVAGCAGERAWNEEAARWSQQLACERGLAGGAFYAQFVRAQSFAFTDADGRPVQRPAEATAVTLTLDGEGVRRTPRASHTLTDASARLTLAGLDGEEVIANGTSVRTATDSLRTRDALQTFDYSVTLAFDDVTGPRRPGFGGGAWWVPPAEWSLSEVHRGWAGAVSGVVSGRLVGVMTLEAPEGVRTREVDQAFSVTFDGEGAATVRLGESAFTVDLLTGEVR